MSEARAQIAALGRALAPDVLATVQDIYRKEQDQFAAAQPPVALDCAYGSHPRQKLDLYGPGSVGGPVPVLLWVHGGGFVRGEKRASEHPYNAHVGRWAARSGMLGAVMNYRLAPDSGWPAGGEDVGAAIAWLLENAAQHGGDPARVVAVGTSAGAVHIATHLRLAGGDTPLAGAALLSGLYGFTPLDDRDMLYYGPQEDYVLRMPRDAVVAAELPLFVACAEFDPPRFQAETLGLLEARLATHGRLPDAHIVGGHNHFSLACHLGTADTRLADELLSFIGAL